MWGCIISNYNPITIPYLKKHIRLLIDFRNKTKVHYCSPKMSSSWDRSLILEVVRGELSWFVITTFQMMLWSPETELKLVSFLQPSRLTFNTANNDHQRNSRNWFLFLNERFQGSYFCFLMIEENNWGVVQTETACSILGYDWKALENNTLAKIVVITTGQSLMMSMMMMRLHHFFCSRFTPEGKTAFFGHKHTRLLGAAW